MCDCNRKQQKQPRDAIDLEEGLGKSHGMLLMLLLFVEEKIEIYQHSVALYFDIGKT